MSLPGFGWDLVIEPQPDDRVGGLTRENDRLYVFVDGRDELLVVDASTTGTAQIRGRLLIGVPIDQPELFADNDRRYIAAAGFQTVDVTDPDQPILLSGIDGAFAAFGIAPNGSGLRYRPDTSQIAGKAAFFASDSLHPQLREPRRVADYVDHFEGLVSVGEKRV